MRGRIQKEVKGGTGLPVSVPLDAGLSRGCFWRLTAAKNKKTRVFWDAGLIGAKGFANQNVQAKLTESTLRPTASVFFALGEPGCLM